MIDANRDYLREWLPWLDVTKSFKDSEKFIADNQSEFKVLGCCSWGIFYQNNHVGMIGLHRSKRFNIYFGEIGYWLAKEMNGKGIMLRSCKAVVDYGFNELNLKRIEIKAGVNNTKSKNIPENLGFKREGIAEQKEFLYNQFVDLVVYAKVNQNWKMK